jgi:hypothetical protein
MVPSYNSFCSCNRDCFQDELGINLQIFLGISPNLELKMSKLGNSIAFDSRFVSLSHNKIWSVSTRVMLILATIPSIANAQYGNRHRASHHRYASSQSTAQRTQMIRTLQSQVTAAKQILTSAESNSAATNAKLNEAMMKLEAIRREMETAHVAVHKASKELYSIEADILANEADDSEFAKATDAVDNLNQELEELLHKLAPPAEDAKGSAKGSWLSQLSKLPEEQRETIKGDPNFKAARESLTLAEKRVMVVRKKLFESSKKWVRAKENLDRAHENSRSEMEKAKPANVKVLHQKNELQSVQNVVANARYIISQGELRLRQLGIQPNSRLSMSKANR